MTRFEPLTVRDLPLLREWLEREHVRRWWRDPIEDAMAEYAASAERSAPTEHYLIVVDDRRVGMAQTYLVSDYPEWDAIVQVGPGVAGVDLFIGETDAIGRGLGPRVLTEFVQSVVFADPETTACVATVEEANSRSLRAFEKAGFRPVREVEEDGVPHRLLRLDRRPQGA
ncbi:MAG TPA: GNAT family N-acetyltransferase [Gaiellaceae bacterium]|nr:GNAT family N-acetyltransferase [Gaiellaceae bacterium]